MTERTINIASQRINLNQGLLVHSKFQVLLRAIWFAGCAGIALAILSGCISQAARMQLEQTIVVRKAESLKGWETVTLDGVPILETLGLRTAIVFCNFESVSVWIDDSGFSGEGTSRVKASVGSAVPISTDGYFLTAAHVVDNAETLDLSVAVWKEDGHLKVETVPARIVWNSAEYSDSRWNPDDPERALDFAIIHADVGPLAPFRVAEELPRIDEPVISAGWPFSHFESFPDGAILAAGHILSVARQDPRGSWPAWVEVTTDTPLVSGESGAPILDRKGNLIGIHAGSRILMSHWKGARMLLGRAPSKLEDFEYSAAVYMPDSDWLWEVIDQDRLHRNAGSATSVPQSQDGLH